MAIYLHHFFLLFKALIRDIGEEQLNLRAMSLVYTTLLSLVPLLALSFSVLKAFGVHNQIEPVLLPLLAPLGEKGSEISQQLLKFVDNMQVGVLGTLGLITLLYSVISLMQKIEEAFNFTWRVHTSRNLVERFSHYLSVLIIGPVLMFSGLGLWASLVTTDFIQYLIAMDYIGFVLENSIRLAPKLLIIGAFAFVYIFIPNTKVKLHAAFIGAIIAGLLWQLTGWLFTSFVVNSSQHTAIYSVFATLFLFMLWMYLGWLILLIGSSLAFYIQNPETLKYQQQSYSLSCITKEKLGITIMLMVVEKTYARQTSLTLQEIKQRLNLPEEMIHEILDILQYQKLLIKNDHTPAGYVALSPLDETNLYQVKQAIKQGNASQNTLDEQIHHNFPQINQEKMSLSLRDYIRKYPFSKISKE